MFEALLASLCIACISLVGVFFYGRDGRFIGSHNYILPMAVGVFLGVVFFDLIPETLELSPTWGPSVILIGFLGFYLLSHFLEAFHKHHDGHDHHEETDQSKNRARKLLIGHTIHNISDGIVVASAFAINPFIGVLTSLGIALHEVPHQIAEFGVLIQSGYTRKEALTFNFISALSIFVGVFITYVFVSTIGGFLFVLTGFAAGNLLYIATADLIPELRHSHRDHFYKTFIATVCGVAIIATLITYTHTYSNRLIDTSISDTTYSN